MEILKLQLVKGIWCGSIYMYMYSYHILLTLAKNRQAVVRPLPENSLIFCKLMLLYCTSLGEGECKLRWGERSMSSMASSVGYSFTFMLSFHPLDYYLQNGLREDKPSQYSRESYPSCEYGRVIHPLSGDPRQAQ